MCGVFAAKKDVEPSRLWGSTSASTSGVVVVALLSGVLLAASCVSSGVMVGVGFHLLLVAVWPAGFRLRRYDPYPAGLRGVLGFSL
jgi:hypothetical protein